MSGQKINSESVTENPGFFTLSLSNLSNSDYLDYMSMWSPRSGISKFFSQPLLRHALGKHTCKDDTVKGDGEFVYSSVICKIPKANYQRLLRDQKIFWLAHKLEEVHSGDLGDKLLNSRSPSYLIR